MAEFQISHFIKKELSRFFMRLPVRVVVISLLALFGVLDCLTTVVAILSGGIELNPFMAFLIDNSLQIFVITKLTVTVCVCFIFLKIDKTLNRLPNRKGNLFKFTNTLVKSTLAGLLTFSVVTVLNNSVVLSHIL
jgi:hypothetical protein